MNRKRGAILATLSSSLIPIPSLACVASGQTGDSSQSRDSSEPGGSDSAAADTGAVLFGTLGVSNQTSWVVEVDACFDLKGDKRDRECFLDATVLDPGEADDQEIPQGTWDIFVSVYGGEPCALFPSLDGVAGERIDITLTEDVFVYTNHVYPCVVG